MSKFEVKVINSKSPFGAEIVEKLEKRINELEDNPYNKVFSQENCDNKDHADHLNKITLDTGTSIMTFDDVCCYKFQEKLKKTFGGS